MEKYCQIASGDELIVRKKVARFIEKYYRFLGYDFRHDLFKQIVYSEEMYKTPVEERMKNHYDAYCYLLNNYKNPLSKGILKKFFYIIDEKEPANDMVTRIATKFFNLNNLPPFERAVDFCFESYRLMPEFDENEKIIVSLMFYNLCLAKGNISINSFLEKDYKEIEARISNKNELLNYLIGVNKNNKTQKKNDYRGLETISFSQIYSILKDEQKLLESYGIKHLFIFGSYAKNAERIDSDVDLLVIMNQDLTNKEKEDNLIILSDMFYKKTNHFVDFMEISDYLNDTIIKELNDVNKIF